ncbi:GNAT family N-acetyltransferase [Allomuricauda sp. SCSIO 64092]|uniref:GNAT family N-acetyltransferase n=1 Tax=Allomuricauda sp. SCSIO 64092 TaxID=2908842 RepID=UPI00391D3FA9
MQISENGIDQGYITELLTWSIENGRILIATISRKIVGEIHAYTPKIHAFQHMPTDVTTLVDPDSQGKGVGRRLFGSFLGKVKYDVPSIKTIELYTHEHNERNVRFYTSLGFINKGCQKTKCLLRNHNLKPHCIWPGSIRIMERKREKMVPFNYEVVAKTSGCQCQERFVHLCFHV